MVTNAVGQWMLFARAHGPVQNRSPDTVGSEHMIESAFRRFLNDEP
jgi:hypothetical protein